MMSFKIFIACVYYVHVYCTMQEFLQASKNWILIYFIDAIKTCATVQPTKGSGQMGILNGFIMLLPPDESTFISDFCMTGTYS